MDHDRTAHATVQDDIDDAYKTAFKAKDEKVYLALRTVLSTIKQATIDQRKELSNEEIIAILKTEVKKRKEVLEQFKQGGRQDLVDQTLNEIDQISKFLPAEMSDEDLETLVKKTLEEAGFTSKADMGKAMGTVMKAVQGQASGDRVKEMVIKNLS